MKNKLLHNCLPFKMPFCLEPMEEDILQVVKYCTDLIEDKDLEKLDLIIRYMKRSVVHNVAFCMRCSLFLSDLSLLIVYCRFVLFFPSGLCRSLWSQFGVWHLTSF